MNCWKELADTVTYSVDDCLCIDGYMLYEHMEQLYKVPCQKCSKTAGSEAANNENNP